MKITKGGFKTPFFSYEGYYISEDCMGRITQSIPSDNSPIYPQHELWDGTRWYTVPKEVFDLWVKAYILGKSEERDDGEGHSY